MAPKTRQAYQYEAPVTPSKWTGEEQRFSLRVKAALEDLYQKFGRLSSNPAADSEKLGGKAPEYYVQPVNLLDNSDFRNPVNQRGKTSYDFSKSAGTYFIDRWTTNGYITVDLIADGITITNTHATGRRYITQILENEALIGKTLTLAVCLSDGTMYTTTGEVSATSGQISAQLFFTEDRTNFIALNNTNGKPSVWIAVGNGCSITLRWVALYEGSYTAETLPPYVPKGYTTELLECQRYFIAFPTYSNYVLPFAHGAATGETTARVEVSLPVPMRINTPSVAADGVTWYLRSMGKSVAATVSVLQALGNKLVLTATVASGLTTYEQTTLAYYGQSGKTLYICFSADL